MGTHKCNNGWLDSGDVCRECADKEIKAQKRLVLSFLLHLNEEKYIICLPDGSNILKMVDPEKLIKEVHNFFEEE